MKNITLEELLKKVEFIEKYKEYTFDGYEDLRKKIYCEGVLCLDSQSLKLVRRKDAKGRMTSEQQNRLYSYKDIFDTRKNYINELKKDDKFELINEYMGYFSGEKIEYSFLKFKSNALKEIISDITMQFKKTKNELTTQQLQDFLHKRYR